MPNWMAASVAKGSRVEARLSKFLAKRLFRKRGAEPTLRRAA